MNSSFQYTGNLAIDNFNLNNFNFISSDQCWGRISRHEVWRTFLRLGEGVNSNIKSSKISTEIRGEDKTRFSPFIPPPPNPNLILKTNLSLFWSNRPTWDLCDIPVISFKTNACIFVIGNKCVFKKYTIRQCVYQQIWETYCTLHRTSTFDFIAKTEIFNLITIFFTFLAYYKLKWSRSRRSTNTLPSNPQSPEQSTEKYSWLFPVPNLSSNTRESIEVAPEPDHISIGSF